MKADNMSVELNAALSKVETEFGLSEILHKYGVSKNESLTVEFKFGGETLFVSQRAADSANVQVRWQPANGQNRDCTVNRQMGEEIGREVAEVFSRANVLSTFKSVLQGRNVSPSIENPVIVEIRSGNGVFLSALKCPCSDQPCCKV